MSGHLTSGRPNNSRSCPVRNQVEICFTIQQPILESQQMTVTHTGLLTIERERENEKNKRGKLIKISGFYIEVSEK